MREAPQKGEFSILTSSLGTQYIPAKGLYIACLVFLMQIIVFALTLNWYVYFVALQHYKL